MKEYVERKVKAYLSDRKQEFHKRGSITNMPREAHPNFLMYSHIKMKARVDTKSPRLSPLGSGASAEISFDATRKLEVSPQVKKTTILDYRTLSMMAKQNKSPGGSDAI